MKNSILILAIVLCSLNVAIAQQSREVNRSAQREDVQNMKIAYMTEVLGLTPAESEKFWPIYNQYWQEKMHLAHARRVVYDKISKQIATQAELNALVETIQDEAALLTKYAAQIAKITSIDKAAKTFVADEKFKSVLLRHARGGSGGKGVK